MKSSIFIIQTLNRINLSQLMNYKIDGFFFIPHNKLPNLDDLS
jgi:hypothetical protein